MPKKTVENILGMSSIRQHFSKPSLDAVQFAAVLGSNQTHLYEAVKAVKGKS